MQFFTLLTILNRHQTLFKFSKTKDLKVKDHLQLKSAILLT